MKLEKPTYVVNTTQENNLLSRSIYDALCENGRFLVRCGQYWREMDMDCAIDKIKQGLRENAKAMREYFEKHGGGQEGAAVVVQKMKKSVKAADSSDDLSDEETIVFGDEERNEGSQLFDDQHQQAAHQQELAQAGDKRPDRRGFRANYRATKKASRAPTQRSKKSCSLGTFSCSIGITVSDGNMEATFGSSRNFEMSWDGEIVDRTPSSRKSTAVIEGDLQANMEDFKNKIKRMDLSPEKREEVLTAASQLEHGIINSLSSAAPSVSTESFEHFVSTSLRNICEGPEHPTALLPDRPAQNLDFEDMKDLNPEDMMEISSCFDGE